MNMASKRLAALIVAAALAACAANPPVPAGVTLIGTELGKLVEVAPVQLSATEAGTSRAWFEVRNRSKSRLMVEGRASFARGQDQLPEAASAWQRVFIEPGSSATMQFLSLAPARQVQVELREGRQ